MGLIPYRHKVSIEVVAQIQGSKGEVIDTWTELTTRRCTIRPLSGNEYLQSQQVNSQKSMEVTMRHDSVTSTVTTKHRLVYDSRYFDIESILNIGELNTTLKFMCREKDA